jgi:hypothetical protein
MFQSAGGQREGRALHAVQGRFVGAAPGDHSVQMLLPHRGRKLNNDVDPGVAAGILKIVSKFRMSGEGRAGRRQSENY